MKLIASPKDMKKWAHSYNKKLLGFVPTMGSLHEGHLSLVERSKYECDRTVVSIYLNETQFNDPKDLETYPVSLEEDIEKLEKMKVDLLFLPKYKDIYPLDYRYRVQENRDSLDLCGKDRPGHFDGVLTVVLKLLNIIRPSKTYFGEKDYQQLQLIRGMVESFFLDTEIVACPTKRDTEGLALSSRNRKLTPEDLEKARFFAQILQSDEKLESIKQKLQLNDISVDYLIEKQNRRYGAVKISNVRLIDNVQI